MSFRASGISSWLLAGTSLPKHAAPAVSSMKRAIELSGHPFCPSLPSAENITGLLDLISVPEAAPSDSDKLGKRTGPFPVCERNNGWLK